MANILEVKNLCKAFKDFSLQNISFKLPRGYIMGFIGPNGAGKSTTIKLIMNLLKKDEGQIKVFGLDHLSEEIEVKNRIGFVYDENHYYEELTVGEMAFVVARLYRRWDNSAFDKYLNDFGLLKKTKIKKLSKGMKMKLSLAIALSHDAELLIMDEPTAGLDPLVRSELLEILSTLIQDEKKAVFFSTHITSDLDKVADFITFIKDGKIVFSETKERIFDSYKVIKGDKGLLPSLGEAVVGVKENQFGFEGLVKDISKVDSGLKEALLIEEPTLEEIMLYTVRGR